MPVISNTTGSTYWKTPELEDQIDTMFIQRVQSELTSSCAIPFPVPTERIPYELINAAQWFWENVDFALEERNYAIPYKSICHNGIMDKIIQLPQQIYSIHGVYKLQQDLKVGAMGDFSLERMLLTSYSTWGGLGGLGTGMGGASSGGTGYGLFDVTASLYEISQFDQMLNPPITYAYNQYSSKLNLIGDLSYSDILIQCFIRCRLQDLYNSYYFFRLVCAFCMRDMHMILGAWEFKYPGGVTLNFDNFKDRADNDIDEIKEWAQNNRANDIIFQPNTV